MTEQGSGGERSKTEMTKSSRSGIFRLQNTIILVDFICSSLASAGSPSPTPLVALPISPR